MWCLTLRPLCGQLCAAMLEAFVHDPLINWRLLNYQVRFVRRAQQVEASLSAAHAGAGQEASRFGQMVNRLVREEAERCSGRKR